MDNCVKIQASFGNERRKIIGKISFDVGMAKSACLFYGTKEYKLDRLRDCNGNH
jgi:hypothetical protein